MVGDILKDRMMTIRKHKYTEYMRSDKGFKILKENEQGRIISFKNLDTGKIIKIS